LLAGIYVNDQIQDTNTAFADRLATLGENLNCFFEAYGLETE
jgi:hypothetical protein